MFRSIANTFANCFKIPELKSRILFTLALLGVCRLMAYIVIPGLDGTALANFFKENEQSNGGLLGMYNMFAGGAYGNCAIGALGIMPYISATIIIQLLTAVWPKLSKLAREEGGRAQIIKYGRYLTVLICLGQGAYFASGWQHPQTIFRGFQGQLVLINNPVWYLIQTVLIMTTGTMLLMWLGEQITDRGIGNGVSLVITIGIVARLPRAVTALMDMFHPAGGVESNYHLMGTGVMLVLLLALVIGGVIAITQAQRKIPVQYAQRAVGRKLYSGGTSFMPLRVNYSGVMPIIFAQSILMFPGPLCEKAAEIIPVPFLQDFLRGIAMQLAYGSVGYLSF
jgi:preprotein translocase subunit SecY